jgi:hypothetical protein
MKNIGAKLKSRVSRLEEYRLLAISLGEEYRAKLVLLVALAILTETANGVTDLKNTKAFSIGLVILNERKKSGDHRNADNRVIGSLRVDNLNVIGSFNTKLLVLLKIGPDI